MKKYLYLGWVSKVCHFRLELFWETCFFSYFMICLKAYLHFSLATKIIIGNASLVNFSFKVKGYQYSAFWSIQEHLVVGTSKIKVVTLEAIQKVDYFLFLFCVSQHYSYWHFFNAGSDWLFSTSLSVQSSPESFPSFSPYSSFCFWVSALPLSFYRSSFCSILHHILFHLNHSTDPRHNQFSLNSMNDFWYCRLS